MQNREARKRLKIVIIGVQMKAAWPTDYATEATSIRAPRANASTLGAKDVARKAPSKQQ